jgi:hypothetical protein
MTTASTSPFASVKNAFAPVTDALNNLQVPEAARDFVKQSASTAKDRAADLQAGSEKVTAAIENAVTGSITEAAKISRHIQRRCSRTPKPCSPAFTNWPPPTR